MLYVEFHEQSVLIHLGYIHFVMKHVWKHLGWVYIHLYILQLNYKMGKKCALCVNFCCVQFAVLYLQIIHLCSKLLVALAKLYVALADSPFDFYYWVIFKNDFNLGSNFQKLPYELCIHGSDFHESILYFLAWNIASAVAQ